MQAAYRRFLITIGLVGHVQSKKHCMAHTPFFIYMYRRHYAVLFCVMSSKMGIKMFNCWLFIWSMSLFLGF